jgi:hypothetical protein
MPAVGRVESTYFRPEEWKADYPNPAFKNTVEEDRFWATRIVASFSDEAIRAIVETARFSDPAATEYLTTIIRERRTKVLRTWLNATNPLVNLSLSPSGTLTFENQAELAAVGNAAERYTVQWSRFDNVSGQFETFGGDVTSTAPRVDAPAELLAVRPEFLTARLRAHHPDHPAWAQPLMAYFRRAGDGWTLVGLERNP